MRHRLSILIAALLAQLFAAALIAFAQAPAGSSPNFADEGWPRSIKSGDTTILIYQPQIDKWENNQIQAYAAVRVSEAADQPETYGIVHFTARTEVDKVNRLVTLQDFKITKTDFPSAPDKAGKYVSILQQAQQNKVKTIAYDRLLAELSIAEAEQNAQGYDLKNDPPRIIFSSRPAVLVLIDGEPVLHPLEGTGLQRVINTRALIIFDPKGKAYYLSLMNGWAKSSTTEGPWSYADSVPSDARKAADHLASSDEVDLLKDDTTDPPVSLKDRVKAGTFPVIYVSLTPAELLTAEGEPQFKPVPETGLLYVSNSDDQIFLNTTDQNYYVLLSGRWFRANSMEGPWQFIEGESLPADFKKIPEGHPAVGALASIPGTTQAREAVIENSTPQSATITRSEANLNVEYDGEPSFQGIEGTGLQYVLNSRTPVIRAGSDLYYAVENGVWFTSASPLGPWVVATSVPAEIYSIPPSCPVHYVTYVKIYGYTPEVVYCGYTPGYYGTVVNRSGVVVFGTGWYYPPYIGAGWIGRPWTYGFGYGFTWSRLGGWSLDYGVGYRYPLWRPWWGPLRVGFIRRQWSPRWGWGRWGGISGLNVYGRWGRSVSARTEAAWASRRAADVRRSGFGRTGAIRPLPRIETRPGASHAHGAPQPPVRPGADHNNVFVGKNGSIYRHDDKNGRWEQRDGKNWKTPDGNFDRRQFDQQRQIRQQGNQRWGNFPGHSAGGGARPGAAPRSGGGAPRSGGGAPRSGGAPRPGGGAPRSGGRR